MLAPPVDTRLIRRTAGRFTRSKFPAAHQFAFARALAGSGVVLLPGGAVGADAALLRFAVRRAGRGFAATAAAAVSLTAVVARSDADTGATRFIVLACRDARLDSSDTGSSRALPTFGRGFVTTAGILRYAALVATPLLVAAALVLGHA